MTVEQPTDTRARWKPARLGVIGGGVICGVVAALGLGPAVGAQTPEPVPPAPLAAPQRAFAPVLEQAVDGDLLLVGNSNLLVAGSVTPSTRTVADVDGDQTALCAARLFVPGGCSDNSSSADLDLPAGARVVAARLYVDTTLERNAISVVARLDGPAAGFDYTDLGPTTAGVPKLWEATGTGTIGSLMRQAVWDVTAYVADGGAGTFTVADIVNDRGPSSMPYASWALAVVYEFDPASGIDWATLTPAEQQRFARRSISWHDGFVVQSEGQLDVELAIEVPTPAIPFAKSYHLVAHGNSGSYDNLIFDGQPLGNSASPGNAVAPAGVVVGTDVACNDIGDVFNDSICALGAPVATKAPGPADYTASSGGAISSGSGVDLDISRIPDRYLDAGVTDATISVRSVADRTLAPGLLAVSVDLVPGLVDPATTVPTPTVTTAGTP